MRGRIYSSLRPVRFRQQGLHLLRWMALGFTAGAILSMGLAIWYRASAGTFSETYGWLLLAVGPVLGLLVGLFRLRTWHDAAVAVDRHYGLKDRIATALAFLTKPDATPLHELQVEDATEHLAEIRASDVVPLRLPIPRLLPVGLLTFALAALLLSLPLAARKAKAGPPKPLPRIVSEAELVEQNLKQLDELAKKEGDSELEKLVQELKKKAEAMKQPGVDVREALAKLSEMQTAIAAEQAQYNTGLVDGQLQALGAAMTPAEALEAAGNALEEAKFDEAASLLDKLENPQLDRKEAKTVEEKMKQVANQMGEVGLGELSDAASELADGLRGGSASKVSKGGKGLAKNVRKHSRRRKINRLLELQGDKLAENKARLGENSLVKGKALERSTSPGLNYGMGTSGNSGEKTSLLAKRNIQEITGDPSEGPSEMETTHSPEGRQRAARGYREAYQKALKKSEAVLDSEPIPLGHRQTIRRYFELIRPQNDEGDKATAKDTSAAK
jgi:hypothetical protein